jgi:hypothetical protein
MIRMVTRTTSAPLVILVVLVTSRTYIYLCIVCFDIYIHIYKISKTAV